MFFLDKFIFFNIENLIETLIFFFPKFEKLSACLHIPENLLILNDFKKLAYNKPFVN